MSEPAQPSAGETLPTRVKAGYALGDHAINVQLAATSLNPTCLIHGWSLVIGQFIVRNQEKIEDVPEEIILPSPLVSQEAGNIDAMFYLSDPKHCLM